MRHNIIMGALLVGAVGGFGSAVVGHRGRQHKARKMADTCVEAVRQADRGVADHGGEDGHRWQARVEALCRDAARANPPRPGGQA